MIFFSIWLINFLIRIFFRIKIYRSFGMSNTRYLQCNKQPHFVLYLVGKWINTFQLILDTVMLFYEEFITVSCWIFYLVFNTFIKLRQDFPHSSIHISLICYSNLTFTYFASRPLEAYGRVTKIICIFPLVCFNHLIKALLPIFLFIINLCCVIWLKTNIKTISVLLSCKYRIHAAKATPSRSFSKKNGKAINSSYNFNLIYKFFLQFYTIYTNPQDIVRFNSPHKMIYHSVMLDNFFIWVPTRKLISERNSDHIILRKMRFLIEKNCECSLIIQLS